MHDNCQAGACRIPKITSYLFHHFAVKAVMHKWKMIRDAYIRSLRNRKKNKRPYKYAEELSFLHEAITSSSLDYCSFVDAEEQAATEKDDTDDSNEVRSEVEEIRRLPMPVIVTTSSTSAQSATRKRCRSKMIGVDIDSPKTENIECSRAKKSTCPLPPIDDDDMNFLKSLLPFLRGFNVHQKLQFRMKVLALTEEIVKLRKSTTPE